MTQELEAAVQQQLDAAGQQGVIAHGATTGAAAAAPERAARRTSTLRRILRQRSAVIGLIILGFLFSIAVLAPVLATHDPNLPMLGIEPGAKPRTPPCIHILGCPADEAEHFFGLDGNARDVYSRMLWGSRVSLTVGFVTVAWSIGIGTLIGAVAGYAAGRSDTILMRSMDLLLAFPALLLTIVIVTILGKGLNNAMLAVGIVSIPIYARVMRSSVVSVREQDYVTAARALGDSGFSILRRRVIPNAITPLIVQGTLGVGTAILEVAALSFIGLAAQAPTAEWGTMIGTERNQLFTSPFLIFIPGVALTLTVLAFNLLGDGLRDAFDPRLSR
jgi:ABC-type dipeptide/oligopeptide/nickel transport system permease subunit